MTPSSKAMVLTDAELADCRRKLGGSKADGLFATIDALKAELSERHTSIAELLAKGQRLESELALKDKVVEALRKARDDLRRGQPRTAAVRLDEALNDLDKVLEAKS